MNSATLVNNNNNNNGGQTGLYGGGNVAPFDTGVFPKTEVGKAAKNVLK